MKKSLLQALARLASIKYQESYLVQGNQNEYVLPEEMLEDVSSLCQLAMGDRYKDTFTLNELAGLDLVVDAIDQHGSKLGNSPALDVKELVYESVEWSAIRSAALSCLSIFLIDIDKLDPIEIDEGNCFSS